MITSRPDPASGGPSEPSGKPAPGRGWRGRLSAFGSELWSLLRGGTQTPLRTSLALGLGLTVCLAVPPPFQTPAALGLAVLLRLNTLVTFAGTLIWQPFTAPFILLFQHRVGAAILPATPGPRTGLWEPWVKPLLVGVPVTALLGGAVGTLACYLVLLTWRGIRGRGPGRRESP